MRYMGSKARHAKEIIPFLMNGHDQNKPYVEPFVGGGNIFWQVPAKIKWGNDTAQYAVALLEALSKGYVPPDTVTEEEYKAVKKEPWNYPPEYVGFVAYSCSFGGKFWGGYARGNDNNGKPRNFASEQGRALSKERVGLIGAHFTSANYTYLQIPKGSTIYCDPPYSGTTKYTSDFEHDLFWQWVDAKAKTCRVFVSEYVAPDWAECVWQKKVTSSLDLDTGSKTAVEKLFKCHSGK